MQDVEHEQINDMASGYYEKPPSRARPLIGFKAPQELKDKIEAIETLWTIRAQVEGEIRLAAIKDPAARKVAEEKLEAEIKAIDFTHVCNRLMKLASEEALSEQLAQLGFDHVPSTDEEWTQIRSAFTKNAKTRK